MFPTIDIDLYADLGRVVTLEVAPQQYLRPAGLADLYTQQDCYKIGITKSDSGTVIGKYMA